MLREQLAARFERVRSINQMVHKNLKLLYSGGLGPNILILDPELGTRRSQ